MPIQINLLSEALAEEDSRRRDPVKRMIYLGAFLVALSLVWFSSIVLEHMVENGNLTQVQADIQAHTNDYNVVVSNLKKITDKQQRLEALQKLSSARFLQGNLMNAMQQLYVTNVSLAHLRVNQSYGHKDSQPGQTIAHTILTLDAKDFSSNSGDQVNHYKDALSGLNFFKTNLNSNNAVQLSNLSSTQTDTDGKPFVLLTLECHFTDQTQ